MDQDTMTTDLVPVPTDPLELRAAIAAIKAEHHVSETAAYAMLVRAALGVPHVPTQRSATWRPTLLAG